MASRLTLIESNFVPLWSTNQTAQTVPSHAERYFPIPAFSVPYLVDTPIVAISASSSSAEETWRFAGHAKQVIRTGLVVGGKADTVSSVKKFYLDQISLLQFPSYAPEFELTFSIPYWLRQITVNIYSYIGPVNDLYDAQLDSILEALTP
jgi:hypothetical protein